jgi:isopenicillin-N N-acyltransferase-like protein
MRKTGRKILKWIGYTVLFFVALVITLFIYLSIVSVAHPPAINDKAALSLQRQDLGNGMYAIKNSWFRKSNSGLYELYTEGTPYEMGTINGKLTKELVVRQEDHFNAQITKMIPSKFYLRFLKYFVGWFNRDLDDNVNKEYREEIFGISQSASDQYQYIGTPYQRILNYHAAHDIGHALQSMALVGCTSFGTWNDRSADSTMIIGRNFDFYVGDAFAEEKIVAFFNPSNGYKFMTVTWGGFIGAVSGMNEKGLAVTINAAKTNMPSGSATPVSLVVREILQYAQNIQEAKAIAMSRKMFVAESFLVASAMDNKAVVIEKTPDALDVYDPEKNEIICANHFQSPGLLSSKENYEQMQESASPYRYKRLKELLDANGQNTVEKTISILRDRKGIGNTDIGMGNEKAINQLIAHHSIVFEPQRHKVWVSTAPWQLGQFVAYDLDSVFALAGMKENREIAATSLNVPADTFMASREFADFKKFRFYKQQITDGGFVQPDSIVASNPKYYHAYVMAGDEVFKKGDFISARKYYEMALLNEIATVKEELYIRSQIKKCIAAVKND